MIYVLPWEEINHETWEVKEASSRMVVAKMNLTKAETWFGKVLVKYPIQIKNITVSATLYRYSVSDVDKMAVQNLVSEALGRYGYEFLDSKLLNLL